MSARVMEIIGRHSAWQEVYSIDESFIGLRGTVDELIATGKRIREDMLSCTGIPVRVGIARSEVLTKLASRGAKADLSLGGVCHLGSYAPDHLDRIMEGTHVTDLWGVASRTGKRLVVMNIHTARDLRDSEAKWMRKKFSVMMERTVYELRGIPCLPAEEEPPAHQDQLIFSRSFSQPVTTPEQMRQVLSIYAQRASARLQDRCLVVPVVSAWAAMSRFKEGDPRTRDRRGSRRTSHSRRYASVNSAFVIG